MPLPKPRPALRALQIAEAADGPLLLTSDLLGELFDRRPRSVGVAVLGAGAPIPKLLNRLENASHAAGGVLEATAQEVVAACQTLLGLLPQLSDRWYWFADPGVPDEGRLRVELVDVVGGELSSGHNECLADLPDGELDLRGRDRFDFPAGSVEIRSERAEARYRAELTKAAEAVASRATVSLSFVKRRAPPKGLPKTFDRAALAHLPRGFYQALVRVCAAPLKALGFTDAGEGRFERAAATIAFERGRFDNGTLAVHLTRDARHASMAERMRFRCDAELETQLRAALGFVESAGVAWLDDPDGQDFEGWKAQGLIDAGARRPAQSPKLP